MRAAILAGGHVGNARSLRGRLRAGALLICADGGVRAARRLGLRPDVVIGDFDSATRPLLAWARARGAELIRHPVEKDKTDAELALDYAALRGAKDVDFFGALGGRLDHLLANVLLISLAADRGIHLRIIDGATEAFLAGPRARIDARSGDLISLLPLTPSVSGVTTRGMTFPLRNATLRAGSSLGISNQVVSRPAVSARSGRLLVVLTHLG